MALLAYEEPEKSPVGSLLSNERNEIVANELNNAILKSLNRQDYSSMERMLKQLVAVTQQLKELKGNVSYIVIGLIDNLFIHHYRR
jgi:hypothetical protein